MKKLFVILALGWCLQGFSQGYTKIYIPCVASNALDGSGPTPAKNVPCEQYMPSVIRDSLCLLISLQGSGATTFTLADNAGPGNWLTANPKCYDSIVSPFDGRVYQFVTLQNCWDSIGQTPIEPQYIGQIIRYMQSHYKIYKKRVYLTGFSQGGTNTVQMASMRDSTASMVQAFVPQSAANLWQIGGVLTTFIYNSTSHTFQFARGSTGSYSSTESLFTKYSNGMWWQHGNTDNIYNITNATSYGDSMWSYFSPHSNFNLTTGNFGHGNWNVMWDPVTPVDAASSPYPVVKWILQFGSGTSTVLPSATNKYLPIYSSKSHITPDEIVHLTKHFK